MSTDSESKASEEVSRKVSPNYKGPDDDFPFRAFRITGFIHLTLGLSVQFLAIVQLAMGAEHRDVFLQFAAAPLWCPIPVIAVGVLGICMSRKRYWEVRCMKVCFGVMSLINAFLFMVIMGALVGFYGFYYYSISNYEPAEADEELRISENPGYTIIVMLILIIAGLEVLVSIFSFFICCCCAHVKRPSEVKKAPPAPKDIPTYAKKKSKKKAVVIQEPLAPETPPAATPQAAAAAPAQLQYGVLVPPGTTSPSGAAAVILAPGGGGIPAGTIMIPGATVPPGAAPPTITSIPAAAAPSTSTASPQPVQTPTPKKKETPKPKRASSKKNKKDKTQAPPNPEKQAPTFTIQIPEYMRINQSPVTHGNGVPQGFVSSPGTTSAYSSSYASIPSVSAYAPSPVVQSTSAPAPYAPGYEPAPAYDTYITTIPNI